MKSFGTLKESQTCGDYLLNKKALNTYCLYNKCITLKSVKSESELLQLRRAYYLNFLKCSDFNKKNLCVNLLTSVDLTDIPVIGSNTDPIITPTIINTTSIPYLTYVVDPSGNLFGNSVCGLTNFENYLVPNT
jgi:hypothetical protein